MIATDKQITPNHIPRIINSIVRKISACDGACVAVGGHFEFMVLPFVDIGLQSGAIITYMQVISSVKLVLKLKNIFPFLLYP